MRLGARAGSSQATQPASEVQFATLDAIAAAHVGHGKPSILRRALPAMTGNSGMNALASGGGSV